MGQWGFFDDEGDNVADMMLEIADEVLPKHLQNCNELSLHVPCDPDETSEENERTMDKLKKKHRAVLVKSGFHIRSIDRSGNKCTRFLETKKEAQCRIDREQWLNDNLDKVASAAVRLLKKEKKSGGWEQHHYDSLVAGTALSILRTHATPPILPTSEETLNDMTRGWPEPEKRALPEELRKMALAATERLLKNIDENKAGWTNLQPRKEALRVQIKLFSK